MFHPATNCSNMFETLEAIVHVQSNSGWKEAIFVLSELLRRDEHGLCTRVPSISQIFVYQWVPVTGEKLQEYNSYMFCIFNILVDAYYTVYILYC